MQACITLGKGKTQLFKKLFQTCISMGFVFLFQVEFEDKKLTSMEEFKASGIAPLGQAPILEVDGKVVAQTGAIARYCGKVNLISNSLSLFILLI